MSKRSSSTVRLRRGHPSSSAAGGGEGQVRYGLAGRSIEHDAIGALLPSPLQPPPVMAMAITLAHRPAINGTRRGWSLPLPPSIKKLESTVHQDQTRSRASTCTWGWHEVPYQVVPYRETLCIAKLQLQVTCFFLACMIGALRAGKSLFTLPL
jgi:hypothetical protein